MTMELEEQYDRIYRYCYYRIRNVQRAEDLTQETFLRYFEHCYSESGHGLAYLYTIAKNLCIDEYKKNKLEEFPQDLPGYSTDDINVDMICLKQVLLELTDHEREIVLLRYVNEVPVNDLSKFYHISRFALYRELKQVLKKLKRRIADEP